MKVPAINSLLTIALLLSGVSTTGIAGDAYSGFYAGIAGGGSFLTGHEIKYTTLRIWD